jgi:hypothetical protein
METCTLPQRDIELQANPEVDAQADLHAQLRLVKERIIDCTQNIIH